MSPTDVGASTAPGESRTLMAALAAGAATVAAWFGWMEWADDRVYDPVTQTYADYQSWQIWALAISLLVVYVAGLLSGPNIFSHAVGVSIAMGVVFLVSSGYSMATSHETDDANMWPVATFLMFWLSIPLFLVVGGLVAGARGLVRARRERAVEVHP